MQRDGDVSVRGSEGESLLFRFLFSFLLERLRVDIGKVREIL